MNDTVIQVSHISKRYRLGVTGTGSLVRDFERWWARVRGKPDPFAKIDARILAQAAGKPFLPRETMDTVRSKLRPEELVSTQDLYLDKTTGRIGTTPPDATKFPLKGSAPSTALRAPSSELPAPSDDFVYALRDVSFEVKRGEVLGIIGRNGAGKSTLLKILSRVTAPTSGEVRIRGRIASLLEVGTGFHPELTGRENIFLNGAILGMTKAEIRARFDEIVAFAEVEKFIDTPVKRYSSGMYVRLAFAVAAHLDPEILIIDEVLAVGDAAFQKKCLGKMGDVAKQGRTVLFVSHNMPAIENLCPRCLQLRNGQLIQDGEGREVVSVYLRETLEMQATGSSKKAGSFIKHIAVAAEEGASLRAGRPFSFIVSVDPLGQRFSSPSLGFGIDDTLGSRIVTIGSYFDKTPIPSIEGPVTITCSVSEPNLAPGQYTVKVAFADFGHSVEAIDAAIVLDIAPADYFGNGRLPGGGQGAMLLRAHWAIARTNSP